MRDVVDFRKGESLHSLRPGFRIIVWSDYDKASRTYMNITYNLICFDFTRQLMPYTCSDRNIHYTLHKCMLGLTLKVGFHWAFQSLSGGMFSSGTISAVRQVELQHYTTARLNSRFWLVRNRMESDLDLIPFTILVSWFDLIWFSEYFEQNLKKIKKNYDWNHFWIMDSAKQCVFLYKSRQIKNCY